MSDLTERAWFWPAVIAGFIVVGILAIVGATKEDKSPEVTADQLDRAKRENEAVHATQARPPAEPASPVAAEPSFSPQGDEQTIDRENAAMMAVYERCSKFAVWREGTLIKSSYASPWKKRKYGWVNVEARLARMATVAEGNVLWYQVTLDKKGKPVTISATKEIAARLCGLEAHEVEYKL